MELIEKYFQRNDHLVYFLILLIAIGIGFYRYRLLNRVSSIYLWLLAITPIVELLAAYFAREYKNNLYIYDPFRLIEFWVIVWTYQIEIGVKKLYLFFAGLILFYIFNGLFWQPFFQFSSSNTWMMSCLMNICLFGIYQVAYFRNSSPNKIGEHPLFWIGCGWLIFSIASILSFGFMMKSTENTFWHDVAKYSREYSNYLLYLSFIPAFLSPQKSLNDPATGK